MSEEKIIETEKTREKYFYIDKEKTKQVLTNIATSFIGAGLALLVFGALHKPPVPPCHRGFDRPMPCPMKMLPQEHGRPDRMMPPRGGDFRGPQDLKKHHNFKGEKKQFQGKDFKKGKLLPPKEINKTDAPVPPVQAETPKK